MRLLVAEKDPGVRLWLDARAREQGVELIFADDLSGMLDTVDRSLPDCVVMDVASSTEAASPLWRTLREHPSARQIPILVYSSSQRWQSLAELASDQVDGYIPRPFTPDSLLSAARARTRPAARA